MTRRWNTLKGNWPRCASWTPTTRSLSTANAIKSKTRNLMCPRLDETTEMYSLSKLLYCGQEAPGNDHFNACQIAKYNRLCTCFSENRRKRVNWGILFVHQFSVYHHLFNCRSIYNTLKTDWQFWIGWKESQNKSWTEKAVKSEYLINALRLRKLRMDIKWK